MVLHRRLEEETRRGGDLVVCRRSAAPTNLFALPVVLDLTPGNSDSSRDRFPLQGRTWPGVQDLWRIATDLDQWKILSADVQSVLLAKNPLLLNKMRGELLLLRIAWR